MSGALTLNDIVVRVEFAARAHAAGVRLALGTDAGMTAVFHGLAVHRELELLVEPD